MPELNPIEEDLNKIEVGIRHLKVQYDMYFSGAMPRQPLETRKELELLLKTINNTPMQRFADRYRYNSLVSKYQTMVELWAKMIRAKEEGRLRPGIPGFVQPVRRIGGSPAGTGGASAAATASSAAAATGRSATAATPATAGRPGTPETAAPAKAPPASPAPRVAPQTRPSTKPASNVHFQCRFTDPAAEEASSRLFYDRFVEATAKSGAGKSERVSYKQFIRQIAAKTKAIKEQSGCKTVTYKIVMKEGAVSLKASPAGEKEEES